MHPAALLSYPSNFQLALETFSYPGNPPYKALHGACAACGTAACGTGPGKMLSSPLQTCKVAVQSLPDLKAGEHRGCILLVSLARLQGPVLGRPA